MLYKKPNISAEIFLFFYRDHCVWPDLPDRWRGRGPCPVPRTCSRWRKSVRSWRSQKSGWCLPPAKKWILMSWHFFSTLWFAFENHLNLFCLSQIKKLCICIAAELQSLIYGCTFNVFKQAKSKRVLIEK